eukprot:PhM_4_TR15264/c0_g1_i4/m.55839
MLSFCENNNNNNNNNNELFIDRDGDLFAPILNYLRTGRWRFPCDCFRGEEEIDLVFEEANFYQIDIGVSDATIPYLLRQKDSSTFSSSSVLDLLCDVLFEHFVVVDRKNLLDFVSHGRVIIPELVDIQEQIKTVAPALRTAAHTREGVDVDSLEMPTSISSVPISSSSFDLHKTSIWASTNVWRGFLQHKMNVISQHMLRRYDITLEIVPGCVCFPYYSTIENEFGLEQEQDDEGEMIGLSKIQGVLEVHGRNGFDPPPVELEEEDRGNDDDDDDDERLYTHFYFVAKAFFVRWGGGGGVTDKKRVKR